MSIRDKLRSFGPGILITAAFIGPGTITTCTLAGAQFGYALLWGLMFSVFATIVLQEMCVRLGLIGGVSLGEALRKQFEGRWTKYLAIILVISAIVIGNAAYETGNILGAVLGIEHISGIRAIGTPLGDIKPWGLIIGLLAFAILVIGSYKSLERILIGLVALMSIAFLSTAIIIGPQLLPMLRGLLVPGIPDGGTLMLIGLIGTTVVPYNLFLHASVVREKWKSSSDLRTARQDLVFSVLLGGIISMSIVVSAAVAFFDSRSQIVGAADLAIQLEPLLGNWAGIFMSVGLFAAGVSSAITAPLAASYACAGILDWKEDIKSGKFRLVWMSILFIGMIFSTIGFNPIKAIVFAQVANGILLPVIAIYLMIVMNSKKLLGENSNRLFQNALSFIVVLIMIVLGLKSLLQVGNFI